ncbi:SpdD protein [Streptomyces avermitilis]|uniref:SpdD protein n=1 Tax=Streptomyces avermitilis TaxID=33903 RepID=UPI0038013A1D
MFLPKYPDNPTPPPAHTHTPTDPAAPAPVRRSLPSISLDQKTVAAVLVGGVVLTALLAAVAVTAVSVAVAAVVLRSLLREHHRR